MSIVLLTPALVPEVPAWDEERPDLHQSVSYEVSRFAVQIVFRLAGLW